MTPVKPPRAGDATLADRRVELLDRIIRIELAQIRPVTNAFDDGREKILAWVQQGLDGLDHFK